MVATIERGTAYRELVRWVYYCKINNPLRMYKIIDVNLNNIYFTFVFIFFHNNMYLFII